MKRFVKFLLISVALQSCAALGSAQQSRQPPVGMPSAPSATTTELIPELNLDTWRELVSPAGRFAASFPLQPRRGQHPLPSNAPARTFASGLHVYSARTSTAFYFVSYADTGDGLPASLSTDETQGMLSGVRDGAVQVASGTVANERNVSLANRHPGRAFVINSPHGMFDVRVYLVGRRIYQVYILTSDQTTLSSETRRAFERSATHFLDSFRLTTESETRESGERYGTARLAPPPAAVAPPPPPRPVDTTPLDRGTLQGSVYTNQFFNLRFEFPSYWQSLNSALMRSHIFDRVDEVMSSDASNEQYSAAMRASLNRTTVLFAIAHTETDARGGVSVIICVAERIPPAARITNGHQFIGVMRNFTRRIRDGNSQNRFEIADTSEEMMLGGRRFEYVNATETLNGETARMRYYATLMRGYALYFMTVYQTDAQLEAIEEILKEVQFGSAFSSPPAAPPRPR